MCKNLTKSVLAIAMVVLSLTAKAEAGSGSTSHSYVRQETQVTTMTYGQPATDRVIYKLVQQTPQYDLRRPEVVSGARVTLFANFLREEPGCVLFILNGTSTECNLIDWKPNSVTVELPRLGLSEPKNGDVQIVLPDGRIAKTFAVLNVSQPDIVIHQESVPIPMPPAPSARRAVYAEPVHGGIVFRAGGE